jgi:aminoglycoside phosphotransferase (APT) family kinase protein
VLAASRSRRRSGGPRRRCRKARSPAQWLRLDDGFGLVDFDGLGVGDPELDVATFVTELRYETKAAIPAAELCQAFTSAYAEWVPLDARRIALYAAHKETAKLLRLARAPRPDAPRRFALALQRLEQAAQR